MTPTTTETKPWSMTAETSGICPLCDKYISKGRSKIAPLPVPLAPLHGILYDTDRRHWREAHGIGRHVSMHPRTWAHARCLRRYDRMLGDGDPIDFAAERRAQLEIRKLATIKAHPPLGSR